MTQPLTTLSMFRNRLYIGGDWVDADDGTTETVTNPATGAAIGEAAHAGEAEATRAVEAAAAAFPAWSATTAAERAILLHRLAGLIEANVEELAIILTSEQGKPLNEARAEIGASAAYVRWFAEEARRVYGDIIPSPWPRRRISVLRQPVGVVAAITPWNFPSSMIARKLGPALAAGCTIVIKPASVTPYSALAWGALCAEAGIPAGVVNIVTGKASAIGGVLTRHPAVRKLSFTGSTEIGRMLMSQLAQGLKRSSMELGGNAPFIIFDDADIPAAVEGAIAGKFRNSGQTCVCVNRFLVQDGVYDAFAKAFSEAVAALKVGDGFDDGTTQGPLIDEEAVSKTEAHVQDALARGGRLLTGGKRHALGGCFYEPTVIADAVPEMAVSVDETFGPLAALFRFSTEDEAIRMANATEYGLACYFYTRDLGRAHRVSEALEYGIVGINEGLVTTEVAPFGGVKSSGMGREGSKYGMDDYLEVKYICTGGLSA